MNLADLQAMTPEELKKLSKDELIEAVLDGVTYTVIEVEEDAYHNRTRQVDKTYAAYSGSLVGEEEVVWTYYPTGEVHKIITDDGEWLTTIKHYRDGKKPEMTKVKKSKG